jgi:hypothetical protein
LKIGCNFLALRRKIQAKRGNAGKERYLQLRSTHMPPLRESRAQDQNQAWFSAERVGLSDRVGPQALV